MLCLYVLQVVVLLQDTWQTYVEVIYRGLWKWLAVLDKRFLYSRNDNLYFFKKKHTVREIKITNKGQASIMLHCNALALLVYTITLCNVLNFKVMLKISLCCSIVNLNAVVGGCRDSKFRHCNSSQHGCSGVWTKLYMVLQNNI